MHCKIERERESRKNKPEILRESERERKNNKWAKVKEKKNGQKKDVGGRRTKQRNNNSWIGNFSPFSLLNKLLMKRDNERNEWKWNNGTQIGERIFYLQNFRCFSSPNIIFTGKCDWNSIECVCFLFLLYIFLSFETLPMIVKF